MSKRQQRAGSAAGRSAGGKRMQSALRRGAAGAAGRTDGAREPKRRRARTDRQRARGAQKGQMRRAARVGGGARANRGESKPPTEGANRCGRPPRGQVGQNRKQQPEDGKHETARGRERERTEQQSDQIRKSQNAKRQQQPAAPPEQAECQATRTGRTADAQGPHNAQAEDAPGRDQTAARRKTRRTPGGSAAPPSETQRAPERNGKPPATARAGTEGERKRSAEADAHNGRGKQSAGIDSQTQRPPARDQG